MSFERLAVLHVPPLAPLNLDSTKLRDQLVSSTFLSSSPIASFSTLRVEPLQLDRRPGLDPVLDSFTRRDITYLYEDEQANLKAQPSSFPTLDRFSNSDVDIVSSPGTSKRPLRRFASSSSSDTLDSSIWDDDFQQPAQPATVKFRGSSAKQRVLDLALGEGTSTHPRTTLLEAIHERAINEPEQSADQHLAPVHPSDQVLRSLVVTATTGTSSDHFQWHPDTASFVWSATLQHRKEVRRLRKLVKEQSALNASLTAAGEHIDEQPPLPTAMLKPWIGSERIMGWSEAASDSIVRPFLDIGALLRRIDDRICTIHRSAAGLCNEAPALVAALDVVVTWFKGQLTSQTSTLTSRITSHHTTSLAMLNAYAELEPCYAVLKTLGNLLSCGQPRFPPFRPLTWLGSTHATLSHLHAHLAASLASGADALPSAVLAYLLDRTSLTWRQQVARWVGFPGFQSDRTGELDDRPAALKAGSNSSGANISILWSGALVDWSLDERGEEDVGYTLKPSAVPSFLAFRHARAFLEAGRALRLLKKAAPEDHPLVSQWSLRVEESKRKAVELPTWTWSSPESREQVNAVEEHITQFKREIARWRRRGRKVSGVGVGVDGSPLSSSVLLDHQPSAAAATISQTATINSMEPATSTQDQFERMSQLFTALPGITDPTDSASALPDLQPKPTFDTSTPPTDDEQSSLLIYLATAACASNTSHSISQNSFDRVTQSSLVAPFESWARLINMSLISVFFQDLGLGTYLETCKRFLLLGSIHFERQVVSSLFDVDHGSALEDGAGEGGGGKAVVAMNRRLTAEGVWPPNDSLLSSALNTAVIETVSGMRQAHEDRLSRTSSGSVRAKEDAVSLAFKDLDERLSFAIVEPRSASTRTAQNKGGKKEKATYTDPSSIDALDWLTLSFHPPALISPLLTQVAQSRYQRLWNLLLRIKRCKVAMRTAFNCTFKSTSAALTFDGRSRALMERFRWEAACFLDTWGAFVNEVGIEANWLGFMRRLERVKMEVGEELISAASPADSYAKREGGEGEEGDADLNEEPLEEEERTALSTCSFELKDVFSLARYHERILDRMLSTCFLKTTQSPLLAIINSLLQSILDFTQLCVDLQRCAHRNIEQATYKDLHNLHRYFQKRIQTLIQALLLLKDRSASSSTHPDSEPSGEREGEGWSKRKKHVEVEKQRMAQEELQDLKTLDADSADFFGRSAAEGGEGGVESVEMLLIRLNASGFYAELE